MNSCTLRTILFSCYRTHTVYSPQQRIQLSKPSFSRHLYTTGRDWKKCQGRGIYGESRNQISFS